MNGCVIYDNEAIVGGADILDSTYGALIGDSIADMVDNYMGNQRAKAHGAHGGLPSFIGGANPPDERKEGIANVCYIL